MGRFGEPGSVWDKPGPLSGTDHERMRLHVYYVERIFNRPEPLRRIGLLAATHHERMDGSGYHRGVGGTMLTTPARLLAAAGQLGISRKTVGNHIEHIYTKLAVTNRAGAAMQAMHHGIVGPVPPTSV